MNVERELVEKRNRVSERGTKRGSWGSDCDQNTLLGMVTHAFNPSTRRQRHTPSSRTAKAAC